MRCTNEVDCKKCKDGYFLDSGRKNCKESCSENEYQQDPNKNECRLCSDKFSNCKKKIFGKLFFNQLGKKCSNSTECEECIENNFLSWSKTKCGGKCPDGEFLKTSLSKNCSKCIDGCMKK